ncbi:hypothetical protein N1027_06240 [Herbiconiux sp. CPCC 205763]|uniref:Uncharacterized protein n=1 Tax=Herbiconiux aconitum TaxID=2970913 RepID=A0ABT2GND7_9MICO|nr:hypothetical protein [Herbiconiux aconitum]MCS5717732.1 hypothetical protein [Herbiconiux aconitum]
MTSSARSRRHPVRTTFFWIGVSILFALSAIITYAVLVFGGR